MKNSIFVIIFVVSVLVLSDSFNLGPGFVVPAPAAGSRTGSGINTYEFSELFEQNKPLSKLAKTGYYTVVEGYTDSCAICKKLEADFTPFLRQRRDVLIRKVHFPENGISQSFTGTSQLVVNQQMADFHERLGRYNFNHVVKTETEYRITSCGTPHIEIYGPERQLIATDKCSEKNLKTGLAFIRKWIKAERL